MTDMAEIWKLLGDWFNPNEYPRGQRDGYAAGRAGRKPSYVRMGLSMPLVFHPGSNVPLETYADGYKAGYWQGHAERLHEQAKQRSRAPAPVPTQSAGTSMNLKNQTVMRRGIEGQIELLEEYIQFLNGKSEELDELMASEAQALEQLEEEGISESFLETLTEFHEEQKSRYQDLKEQLEETLSKCRSWVSQLEEVE